MIQENGKSTRLRAMLVTVFAFGAWAASVASGDDRGFVVEVDAWSAAPARAGLEYAFVVPEGGASGSLSGGGTVRSVSPERETATAFRIGKRFDRPGRPSIEFAFREHDSEGRDAVSAPPAGVGALLASPDFAVGRSLVESAEGDRRLRTTVGEAWLRFRLVALEHGVVEVGGGVRWFRVEHETSVAYRLGTAEQILVRRGEAGGIGPAASVSFQYHIASRVRFGAAVGLAVPIGDLDGSSSDIVLGDRFTLVDRAGERSAFFQPELEIRLTVRVLDGFEVFGAWRWVDFGDVVRELRFVDDVGQNAALVETSGHALEGVALGARWSF